MTFFVSIVCPGAGSGEFGGGDLPGARLSLGGGKSGSQFHFQANENHPGARVRFEIEANEKRGPIRISRESTFWFPSSSFRVNPSLQSATLTPAAPFSGHATFNRNAAPANRWSGNLTVDLPGRSNFPLTAPGLTASLAHACFQGEGAGSRADCG